jgi:hypothetical protein
MDRRAMQPPTPNHHVSRQHPTKTVKTLRNGFVGSRCAIKS